MYFMRRGRRIAEMNCPAVEELITPDAGIGKGSRDGTANAAGIVFDDDLPYGRQGHFGRMRVVPATSDDYG